ncbi:MAG: restriction endonuclease [Candidatus Magasanikbacteria bacterium]|nr:restriction endonuclease [Candidatus Magasanikbacteria bacterium]
MEIIILLLVVGIPIWIIAKIAEYFLNQKSTKEKNILKQDEIKEKFGDRVIDKGLSLEKRNDDIIQEHIEKLRAGYHRSYYIENSVRDCIDEIATAEGYFQMAPGHEYLSNWTSRANAEYLNLKDSLLKRFRARYDQLRKKAAEKEEREINNKYENLRNKYSDLIQQFFEITERKVSVIDDYGDEHWEELPKQIDVLTDKILKKEYWSDEDIKKRKKFAFFTPDEVKLLSESLQKEFKTYHAKQKQKKSNIDTDLINKMTGVEFETLLAKKITELGYEVTGTQATGDQGADLIAKKNGKKIIIQAKRYSGSVGNKSVQEVVGAIKYYQGDSGCVITNSVFTPSAKALAQKNDIILIDGHDLKIIEKFFS